MHQDRARLIRDATILALSGLVVRSIVLAILPEGTYSNDVGAWVNSAGALRRGENPYVTTVLNWPPFWMQILYVLQRIAGMTDTPITSLVRWLFIAVETLNIPMAYLIAARLAGPLRARTAVLFGYVLNPVAILLVCQHGNFDVFVAMALLVFLLALLRYERSADVVDWLTAAFALSIGILIKTIPLVLSPMLAYRSRLRNLRARILGVLLLLTPVIIGMSVIYVLAPHEVTAKVLRYRSIAGWFGVSGLLELGGLDKAAEIYASIFPLIVISALVLTGRYIARHELSADQLNLTIATILAALIALGPGYGPHYITWVLPFYVISFVSFDRRWRSDLIVAWIIFTLTYVVEYAMFADQGQFLIHPQSSARMRHISDVMAENGVRTLMRLPLFAIYIWLIVAAIPRLRAPQRQQTAG